MPQFDARRLIGANFDTFHRNPAHQRNLLANLKGEYKTEIQVSGLTFSLVANPIVDAQGERLGTVVEWKDRTAEVAAEHEINQIVEGAVQGTLPSASTWKARTRSSACWAIASTPWWTRCQARSAR